MSSTNVAMAGEEPKWTWPEVVGLPIKEAKEIILRDKPDADIVVLPVGTRTTRDLRPDRVRIFVVDDTAAVANAPNVG